MRTSQKNISFVDQLVNESCQFKKWQSLKEEYSVCNLDKPTVKYVRQSIFKFVVLIDKLISNSNVCSSKHVSASSIYPSKPICGSDVRSVKPISASANIHRSKPFSAIDVHASKSICSSSVCSRKPLSVSGDRPSKTISAAERLVEAIPVVLSMCIQKSASASNICRNNVRSSKPICRNNVCQSTPATVKILPCKPVCTDHNCHVICQC